MHILTAAGMFFAAMENRLINRETAGWTGWKGKFTDKNIKARLMDNAERGDWVDVANLAMILWARKRKRISNSLPAEPEKSAHKKGGGTDGER